MPLKLSPEDRRLALIAAAVFLVSAGLAVFLSPSESSANFATSYSAASEGAKAAYLLLQESGYRVERWSRPPAELNDPANTIVIIADPVDLPEQADREALAKFMDNGGEVVLAGIYSSLFVSDAAPTAMPLSTGEQKVEAQAPSRQALDAPEIQLTADASWTKDGPGVALYGDQHRCVVMQFAHGRGSLLWLVSSSLLSNAGLRESNNLAFLLSTVGGKSRRALWDEYFHGNRTAAAAAAHPQLKWLFGQLGFIAVAVLLTFSRRSGPQRAPRAESRLSPLEYVRALGELYEHADAANVAVDVSYERFRYALVRRLGLRPSTASEELARAVADRWTGIDGKDLLSLLESCESARFFEDLKQKEALDLVQRLHKYSVLLKLFPDPIAEQRHKP